jgi:hypothetical protein
VRNDNKAPFEEGSCRTNVRLRDCMQNKTILPPLTWSPSLAPREAIFEAF